ncbi:hypothetical protein [Brevibacterium spongiae]|uniref:Secreted protein n=1 Tax=Brevibacterium spongiae TaxID=2909672 RepID=A0ABY5SPJ0_9MICO|nr:hypothetical protein [Brevibacterium spongiae]UVI35816.1 hypothetical protein L1F31_17130 [Brevibacterium spongiae]
MSLTRATTAAVTTIALMLPLSQMSQPAFGVEATGESRETVKELRVTGFDKDVAREHGYRIEQGEDGTFSSVPVTREAKDEAKALKTQSSDGGLDVQSTVSGTCGKSSLYVGTPSSKKIQIDTGYTITLDIPAHRTWGVSGSVGSGTFDEDFSGFSAKSDWSETRQVKVGDSSSGFAQLNDNSKVVLTTGVVCKDMNPSDKW